MIPFANKHVRRDMQMMICIAPAKRMRKDIAYLDAQGTPKLLKETKQLAKIMQQQDVSALRHILSCSERIAQEAYQIFQTMQLTQNAVPALLAYDGIQYTYMAPDIFSDEQFAYVQKHLRILSGFYGVLKPLDGVVPYRLEINSLLRTDTFCNLYAFWQDKLYRELIQESSVIVDLASAQYSRCITRYKRDAIRYVKCRFMEETKDTLKEKGVYVKMARGEMVRYMAEHQITDIEDIKQFQGLGYRFQETLSSSEEFIFTRAFPRKK